MGGDHEPGNRLLAYARAVLAASVLLSALGQIEPATAQPLPGPSTPAATTSSAAPCELDVWPAATTHTTFQGWVRAGAVDGARRGMKGYPDLHADALDIAQQVHLLATVDWRGAFNDPSLAVVIHPEPTGSDNDRTRTNRLVTEGSSVCYRELIVVSSIIESEVFSNQSVRVLALRKRFDGVGSAPVTFSSMSEAEIQFTDADKAAADSEARMDAAVRAAFVSAVGKFATMQSFH